MHVTQLAHELMGWGMFLLPKAIPIFRTSLENYIKLLKVYPINLSDVSAGIALEKTAMSGSSGDDANGGFPEFGRCSSACRQRWPPQDIFPLCLCMLCC